MAYQKKNKLKFNFCKKLKKTHLINFSEKKTHLAKFKFLNFLINLLYFGQLHLSMMKNCFRIPQSRKTISEFEGLLLKTLKDIEYFIETKFFFKSNFFFLKKGIFQFFRFIGKFQEISRIFMEIFKKHIPEKMETNKKLDFNIFVSPKSQRKSNNLLSTRDSEFKKKKNNLYRKDLHIIKKTIEKDITNLNQKLESNLIKQIYRIEQIDDDSKKSLLFFSKIKNIVKTRAPIKSHIRENLIFVIIFLSLSWIFLLS